MIIKSEDFETLNELDYDELDNLLESNRINKKDKKTIENLLVEKIKLKSEDFETLNELDYDELDSLLESNRINKKDKKTIEILLVEKCLKSFIPTIALIGVSCIVHKEINKINSLLNKNIKKL